MTNITISVSILIQAWRPVIRICTFWGRRLDFFMYMVSNRDVYSIVEFSFARTGMHP